MIGSGITVIKNITQKSKAGQAVKKMLVMHSKVDITITHLVH